jgi:prephenate dehydrogenase
MAPSLRKVVVVGVGLIGGSFALALKRAKVVDSVVGVGRSPASLAVALERGIIDRTGALDHASLNDADLVLLAMPVGQMAATMRAMAPHLGAQTVVSDAGSTKQSVCAAAGDALSSHLPQVVPAHPIAGAELSGPAAAKADLFDGKRVVMTPLAQTSPAAKNLVANAWKSCGAQVSEMSAESHDKLFAAVSHLPHLLAYALVDELRERDNAAELFGFAAGGFRDFTRIASSDAEMWRDIFLDNRARLSAEMDAYVAKLQQLQSLLSSADAVALERLLRDSRDARNEWVKARARDAGPA